MVADYDRGMALIGHDGTYTQILDRYGLNSSYLDGSDIGKQDEIK